MTYRRFVMKFSDGSYYRESDYHDDHRTDSLIKAKLYDLVVVPAPRQDYSFIPITITIEEDQ